MDVLNLVEDGAVFLAPGLINRIIGVLAGHWFVGGDDQDAEFVDVQELRGFGFGGAGHAGQFVIKPEIILDGDGRQRLSFALDLDLFLGFDGLVEAVAPAPARH